MDGTEKRAFEFRNGRRMFCDKSVQINKLIRLADAIEKAFGADELYETRQAALRSYSQNKRIFF